MTTNEARVLDLPVTENPTTEGSYVEAVRVQALAWLAAGRGRSQGDLSRLANVKRSTLNAWLRRKYAGQGGDEPKIAKAVAAGLLRDEQANQVCVNVTPVVTPCWERVHKALALAKARRKILLLSGEPGCGKTYAASHFASMDPRHCLLVMTRFGLGGVKGFLAELIRLLKKEKDEHFQYASRMSRWVIDDLREFPRFLIINDAHRLGFGIYDLACDLVEQAGVGVAFVGHDSMMDEFNALKTIDHRTYDRVRSFSAIVRVTHRDCPDDAIAQVARQILPEIDDGAVALLVNRHTAPNMREVVDICETARALRLASKKPQAANRALIQAAIAERRSEGV